MTDQIIRMANAMFDDIVAKVDSPADAGELVLFLHYLIWMNARDHAPMEEMLDDYKEAFIRAAHDQSRLRAPKGVRH